MANKQLRHTAAQIDEGLDQVSQMNLQVGDLDERVTELEEHGGGGGIEEAPSTGRTYGRMNGEWVINEGGVPIMINNGVDVLETDDEDNSDGELYISDEKGNVIAMFTEGGLQTKDFSSNTTPQNMFDVTEADFKITDESGNSIVEFASGHIKTKNFDSSKSSLMYDVVYSV